MKMIDKSKKKLAPTMQQSVDETIPKKYLTIALGATIIGSAESAPDESYQ
jgi:hypothetical protein